MKKEQIIKNLLLFKLIELVETNNPAYLKDHDSIEKHIEKLVTLYKKEKLTKDEVKSKFYSDRYKTFFLKKVFGVPNKVIIDDLTQVIRVDNDDREKNLKRKKDIKINGEKENITGFLGKFNTFKIDYYCLKLGFNNYAQAQGCDFDITKKNDDKIVPQNTEQILGKIENTRKEILEHSNTISHEIKKENKSVIEKAKTNILNEIESLREDIKKNTLPKYLTINVPAIQESEIIGRRTEIEKLYISLFNKKETVLIRGLGGIGKTTLASVYATKFSEKYSHIVWIEQFSNNFKENIINSRGLLFSLGIDKEDKSLEELFQEIMTKLNTIKDVPCLMVIDNAEYDLCSEFNLLPKQPNWHVIVTSREEIPFFHEKELDLLSESEAMQLFRKNYKYQPLSLEFAKKIVKHLDNHTLAIEVLGKTANHQKKSPLSILNFLEENMKVGVAVKHSMSKIDKITSYLCSIFQDLAELTSNEKFILKQFAYIPPEFHDYQDLENVFMPYSITSSNFDDNLLVLEKKGWVIYDKKNNRYKLHRIFIEVINKSLSVIFDDIKDLFNCVCYLLSDEYDNNFIQKFKWIPFGRNLLDKPIVIENTNISNLHNRLGLCLKNYGSFNEAKEILEQANSALKDTYGEEHSETMINNAHLSLVYLELGENEKAKDLLEIVTKFNENKYGEKHETTIIDYSNLGAIYHANNDLEKAKYYMEKVINFNEERYGELYHKMASDYSNLALVYRDLGDLNKAKEYAKKSVSCCEHNYDNNHPFTIMSYNTLANIYSDLKNRTEARDLFIKISDFNERNLGLTHPKTAKGYYNLAISLFNLREYNNVINLLEKAIKIAETFIGKNHPETLQMKDTLMQLSIRIEMNKNDNRGTMRVV